MDNSWNSTGAKYRIPRKYSFPSATSTTTNPTWDVPGIELGPQRVRIWRQAACMCFSTYCRVYLAGKELSLNHTANFVFYQALF